MTAPMLRYLEHLDAPALDTAIRELAAGGETFGLLVLLPEREKAHVPLVQAAAKRAGVPVVGALFPLLVRDGGFVDRGAWLFVIPGRLQATLLEDVNRDGDAARRIAGAVRPSLPPDAQRTLFMIFDAMLPNVASIVEALYVELADRVQYLGVNAGSETFTPLPCLFDEARVVSDGVLCVVLPEGARSALLHDYASPEEPSIATATSENRVATIDWRPAFQFYREKVKAQFGVELTRENFYRFAVQYPLGILQANGQVIVRMPTSLEEDGSIRCLGEVPPHSLLAVVQAPPPGSQATAAQLTEALAARDFPAEALFFYCAGRRLRLGETSPDDLRALVTATRRTLGGATCLGEVGITAGVERAFPNFHNGSFVATAWQRGR